MEGKQGLLSPSHMTSWLHAAQVLSVWALQALSHKHLIYLYLYRFRYIYLFICLSINISVYLSVCLLLFRNRKSVQDSGPSSEIWGPTGKHPFFLFMKKFFQWEKNIHVWDVTLHFVLFIMALNYESCLPLFKSHTQTSACVLICCFVCCSLKQMQIVRKTKQSSKKQSRSSETNVSKE